MKPSRLSMAAWRFRVTRRLGYRQPVRRRPTGLFESIASASPLGHGALTPISKQPSCRRPACATVLAQACRKGGRRTRSDEGGRRGFEPRPTRSADQIVHNGSRTRPRRPSEGRNRICGRQNDNSPSARWPAIASAQLQGRLIWRAQRASEMPLSAAVTASPRGPGEPTLRPA
jgi:hypothetical protein